MKVSVGYDSNASTTPSSPSSSSSAKSKNSTSTSKLPKQKKAPKKYEEDLPKSYPKWHNVAAGAAAGAGARFFTAPLDLIKIRRQLVKPGGVGVGAGVANANVNGGFSSFSPFGLFRSLRDIVRNEGGLPSLFRGNLAATYLWIGYAAVQFSLYARTSDFIANAHFQIPPNIISNSMPPPMIEPAQNAVNVINAVGVTFQKSISCNPSAVAFCSGAIAGTAATLATYPFDICRTAFATRGLTISDPSSTAISIQSFFKHAASNSPNGNPLRNLFAGCGPAVLGIIPYMGINFALYDYLVRKGEKTKVGDAGMAGAIAGGTSKLIVYPLDTVKKRLQAQAFNTFWGTTGTSTSSASAAVSKTEYKNLVDCAMKIAKDEGINAFYRGLVPTVLKTMSATGLTFAIFTFTKNTLETTHDWYSVKEKDIDQR